MLTIAGMAKAERSHEHHREGEALMRAAQSALEAAGERWTEMRATIFGILADFERAAPAYEIAERVSAARGRRIAPNSVYRILDLFVANNLAKRVETANAFVVNSHPGCVHDCIFLVCEKCGGVTHVDDDRIAEDVRRAAADAAGGFMVRSPVIEIKGLCARCGEEQAQ